MRKFTLFTAVFIMGLIISSPDMMARGRQTTNTNEKSSPARPATSPSRPSTANTRPAVTTQRPTVTSRPSTTPSIGTSSPRPNSSSARPGTSTTRPGTGSMSPATPNRPGTPTTPPNASTGRPGTPNNGGASQRPPTPNVRPSSPTPTPPPRPNGPNYGTPPPPPRPNGYQPGYSYRPPLPHTPPSFSFLRPTPPPNWRPTYRTPSFSTFLGLTLGALFSNSINSLFNSGYNVTGYTSNEVYLNNVTYCNVNWPNVTMYYNNGFLCGSLFSTSTYVYDLSRYNYLYSYLTNLYGYPVSSQNMSAGGKSCTWWGNNNTFMTLSFYPEYINGNVRYFTTLTTGN